MKLPSSSIFFCTHVRAAAVATSNSDDERLEWESYDISLQADAATNYDGTLGYEVMYYDEVLGGHGLTHFLE